MTVGAFRNQTVPSVAAGAADLAVLAGSRRPFGINGIMADTAGPQINRLCQGDVQGLMHIMTLGTGRHLLTLEMGLMTFGAARDIAVSVMMTTTALLLGMLARCPQQLAGLLAVTAGTEPSKVITQRYLPRRMRVVVAVQTLYMLGAMRRDMAGGAFWHNLRVIVLTRVVGMEYRMTLPAVKLMFPTRLFQVSKGRSMTLGTLIEGERLRRCGVK